MKIIDGIAAQNNLIDNWKISKKNDASANAGPSFIETVAETVKNGQMIVVSKKDAGQVDFTKNKYEIEKGTAFEEENIEDFLLEIREIMKDKQG